MNSDALEQEVKLEAGIGFRVPDLDGVAVGITARSQPEQKLQAAYVDTADLRLARSGLTLRHRSDRSPGSSPGEWTLKLPEESIGLGLTRRELNWPGRWGPIPGEVAGLVRAYRRTAALGPVARLVSHRRRTLVCGRSGEPLLEIDDDVVSVMDGRRLAARFREVEVEVVGPASVALLNGVVARLAEAGALPGDGRSKLARAIGYRATEPPDVTPVEVGRTAPMGEVVRAAVAHAYLRLVAHDLGIRLDEDPEDVHQGRVATRRLRSDLRTFRAFLPEDWSQETRRELGWLADALGQARDADVLLGRLRHQVDSLEPRDVRPAGALVAKLVAEQDRARQQLHATMDTDRYGELLDRLVAAARELPPLKASGQPTEMMATVALVDPTVALVDPTVALVDPTVPAPAPGGDETGIPEPPAAGEAALATWPQARSDGEVAVAAGPPALVLVEAHGAEVSSLPPPLLQPGRPEPEADRDAPARRQSPSVVAGPWRHLAKAVAALDPVPADEALHEVRIRAKRLRYACEAVGEVVGKPATVLARSAAELQGVLGDFHDAIVAEEWLRSASAKASGAQALAAGQLIARERDDAARCRSAWVDSWEQLNRKKLRAWLR